MREIEDDDENENEDELETRSKRTSMLVALHRGEGWIARAIRWQTRSVYSHASVLLEDAEMVIEAREFQGVRVVMWREVVASGEVVDLFRVKDISAEQEKIVREFLWEQMGKGYDYTMVARFVSRRQEERASSGKWFCSELVFAALAKAGVRLLERIEAWEVSPGVLRLSTRLEEVKPQNTQNTRSGEMKRWGNIQHRLHRPANTSNSEYREGEHLATDGTRIARMEGISDLRSEISKGREMGSVRRYQGLFRNWIGSGFGGGAVPRLNSPGFRTPRPTGMGDSLCREEWPRLSQVVRADARMHQGCRQDAGSTLGRLDRWWRLSHYGLADEGVCYSDGKGGSCAG